MLKNGRFQGAPSSGPLAGHLQIRNFKTRRAVFYFPVVLSAATPVKVHVAPSAGSFTLNPINEISSFPSYPASDTSQFGDLI